MESKTELKTAVRQVKLTSFAEARLAELLLASSCEPTQPLTLWRVAKTVEVLPRAMRVGVTLRALGTLRARDRWETSWTRALAHPACPAPRRDAVFDRQELWGLPADDWLCTRCGRPLFVLEPYQPPGGAVKRWRRWLRWWRKAKCSWERLRGVSEWQC